MRKLSFSRKSLGIPYALFLLVFVIAPLLVLFYYAFIFYIQKRIGVLFQKQNY